MMEIEEIKDLYKYVIRKLGEIEVLINYYKQSKFDFDNIAQENLILLKDDKKHYQNIKERMKKKLKGLST